MKANSEATEGTDQQQGIFAVDEILGIDSTASATAGAAGVASTSVAGAKATNAAGGKGNGNGRKGATGGNAKGGKNNDRRARAKRSFIS